MIVVDSSVWVGVFANVVNPHVEAFLSITDRTQILVGDIVLLEVLRGARSDGAARRIEAALSRFTTARMLNPQIAISAARNYRHLRTAGITIRSSADLIIGTFCIEGGHRLLYRDRDFEHMRQLGLEAYAT